MTSKLILIGGVPGSGKTYIGKQISKDAGVFIDKDTISRFFTEALLEALGACKDDREGQIYLSKVRGLEYDTMRKQAFENLNLGHDVICSAPFIQEFIDQKWINDIEIDLEIEDAELIKIWIQVDERTARERLISRRADRDNGKLSSWDEYVKIVKHAPPEGVKDLIVIDNTPSPTISLGDQINSVITRLNK